MARAKKDQKVNKSRTAGFMIVSSRLKAINTIISYLPRIKAGHHMDRCAICER
ncbi:hypothetical protein [Bacteroidetes bacterium endosymbiont of Geopemphigus sp.]|uniref:hypothetical protein n=1 Tax=Bacteroidetes bacterium endosymbiont of Geopemphigus sp. TaxID=2047937 RepID=UPI0018A8237D|nr:hypothetical protein [Bacteroidetes bacterium endosymbiont of Geopemphigus sp.]